MSGTEKDVEQARHAALQARERVAGTMSEILERLHPRYLLNQLVEDVRQRGQELADHAVDAARARPVAVSATVAAIVAYMAREPITKALSTLVSRRGETERADGGLKAISEPSAETGGSPRNHEEVA